MNTLSTLFVYILSLVSVHFPNMQSPDSLRMSILKESYIKNDYDAFYDAFPNDCDEFTLFYGYDDDKLGLLYDLYYEHILFFFDNLDLRDNQLDKLFNIAQFDSWKADGQNWFIAKLRNLLLDNPMIFVNYLNKKTDRDVCIFFRALFVSNYLLDAGNMDEYKHTLEVLSLYSNRIATLLEKSHDSLLLESGLLK